LPSAREYGVLAVSHSTEAIVARTSKRRQDFGPPEKWGPGRTLDSIIEMRLTADDLSEAARLLAVEDEKLRIELAEELQSVARLYWERHRDAARPSAKWYRTKVGAIQKSAENLLKLIREPRGTALVGLKYLTQRRMGRLLLGGPAEEPLSIEQLLDQFVSTCKSCTFKSDKGAPPIADIKAAVAALREVWIKFTGKEFPLNVETGENRRDRGGRLVAEKGHARAFISPGPRFAQVMMQRIDPNVRWNSIRTAVRDACEMAEHVD
jgi:hypothetical protein